MENKINDVVLLGGADAEMAHIKKKLDKNWIENVSKELEWWAWIETYSDEISSILEGWKTPVAIELKGAWGIEGVIDIDHHGDRSNEPAAILQIMERYWMKINFFDKLIAANDSWFIYAMQDLLNSKEFEEKLKWKTEEQKEKIKSNLISRVRKLDRSAQWITDEQEAEAISAILKKEEINEWNLTIVRLKHSKWATVTDRLFWKYKNLLILSEDWECNFYWDGEICKTLWSKYEWSWTGGEWLGVEWWNAFFGWYVDQNELEKSIKEFTK